LHLVGNVMAFAMRRESVSDRMEKHLH
jgi:hypothetical protein